MTSIPRLAFWTLLVKGVALWMSACSGPAEGSGSPASATPRLEGESKVPVTFLTRDIENRPLGGVTITVNHEGSIGDFVWPCESDAYGHYRHELVPGRYELVARVDGFVNVQRTFDVDAGLAKPIRLTFEGGQSIRGRLVDAWGVGVPFQEVWSTPSSEDRDRFWRSFSWAVTDGEGYFELRGLADDPVDLSLHNEGRHAPPELARPYEGVLPGTEDLLVELADEGRVLIDPIDAGTGQRIPLLETDPDLRIGVDWRCRFASGWMHGIHISGFAPAEIDLRGPDGPPSGRLAVSLEPLDLGGELTLRVVDSKGEPLSDVELYAGLFNSPWIPAPTESSDLGDIGVFRFRGLSSQVLRLVVQGPRHESENVDVDWVQGEQREVRVTMNRRWPVEISFVDAGGHGVWHTLFDAEGEDPRCGTWEWIKRGVPAAHRVHSSLGKAWTSKFDHCGPHGTAVFIAPGEYVLKTRLGQSDWREHRVWVDDDTGPLTLLL